MPVVRQYAPLSMGWCINCHRQTDVKFTENKYYDSYKTCLLYTSDAADERSSVDLGGRRIIKKKNKIVHIKKQKNKKKIKQNKRTQHRHRSTNNGQYKEKKILTQ